VALSGSRQAMTGRISRAARRRVTRARDAPRPLLQSTAGARSAVGESGVAPATAANTHDDTDMASEWVGVVGGLVGVVVGVSGSVIVQWLGDRHRGRLAREQWAEERKVRYRDERKVAYERFMAHRVDLLNALLDAGGSNEMMRPGPQNGQIIVAASAISGSLDEFRLIGSVDLRLTVEKLRRLVTELRVAISDAEAGVGDEVPLPYPSWRRLVFDLGNELVQSATT